MAPPPPAPPDDPENLQANLARRVLSSLDRMEAIAAATEDYIARTELRARDLADLVVAAGNLREKHVLASAKVFGDLAASLKPKRKIVDA